MAIYHNDLSEGLQKFFKDSVDLAIENLYNLQAGEVLLPSLLYKSGKKVKRQVFLNDSKDPVGKGIDDAKRLVQKNKSISLFVISYEGSLKLKDGASIDAIILEGEEQGQGFGFVFAQRFKRSENGEITLIIGNDFVSKTNKLIGLQGRSNFSNIINYICQQINKKQSTK